MTHERTLGEGPEGNPEAELARVLAGAVRGDSAAWSRLVELYGRRVYALAQSRCRRHDVSEEITQSIFATLAAKLGGGEYKEQGRFEAWLFRMAMNRIRDHVRKERKRPEALDLASHDRRQGSMEEGWEGVGSAAEPELDALRRALARLAESDREVIELRHHGQMSFKDMAELLEEPLGTLLARHHRALKKLRELMEAKTAEPEAARVTDRGARR